MQIHCDNCGAVIRMEDARERDEDGVAVYFCSVECMEAKGYHELVYDPGPEADSSALPDPR